ncbi:MAG: MFS transporter [Pseudomonadales bacterium]|nr:MFS transporter [Pseudomonadales bacterium]
MNAGTPGAVSNRPLQWYLAGTAFFLIPGGIQQVLFPWLVAVYLMESPARVGLAQMASQLPMVLLILWGGLIGDRLDQRRLLILLQCAMILPPLLMAVVVQADLLAYQILIVWALVGGSFGAFAQPARDALLNRVAGHDIQRVVTLAVGVQFGVQIVGFGIGSVAEWSGPVPLLVTQAALLGVAALATARIPPLPPAPARVRASALREIAEGLAIVWRSDTIRPAVLMTFAVGVFFAGTYMVILPLMVRDIYAGSAGGIALVFAANMLGTCTTIFFLMRRGGLARPGRAMLIGSSISVCILSILMLELSLWAFYLVVYLWGLCGGISMTMSRAIVQEASPESHRARVLSVYSLGMMGGMPFGSLLLGWCVGAFGARQALLVPVLGMLCVVVLLLARSRLWHVRRAAVEVAPAPPAG